MRNDFPAFGYWIGDRSLIADFEAAWQELLPSFRIFGDSDVLPLLERRFLPQEVQLYRRLRLPAARADIARLLLLHEHGGLYVDCHWGIREPGAARSFVSLLDDFEAVLVDRSPEIAERDFPDERFFVNGLMAVRPRLDLVVDVCRQALANLRRQDERERDEGFYPYDLSSLTGGALLTAFVMAPGSLNCDLRADLEGRIAVVAEEELPFVRARFASYTPPGMHWSARQESEPLFEFPGESCSNG